MDITPLIPKERKVIKGYGNGAFTVNDAPYQGSIIVFTDSVLPWGIDVFEHVTPESLEAVINRARDVELLLIGSGANHRPIPPTLRQALKQHNIALELMTTGAACRTYNVLLSEERRVAAALLAV